MNNLLRNVLKKSKALRGLLVPVLLLIYWQYASGQSATHRYAFVPLQDVGASFVELVGSGELWINLLGSIERTGVGLVTGVAVGFALGLAMYFSRIVLTLVHPLYTALRQVPLLGLTPLIGIWLGNGDEAKVFIIALAAFYPMVLNTYEGLRNVDSRFREVGEIYGFNHWQQFRRVLLPAAVPSLITGLLLAIPFAWITCIGSELLFNAGAGLGNLMMTAELAARMDIILICALVVTTIGILMNYGVSRAGDYLLRWRGRRK
ncbi:MAG: ABC transporter permease [Cellvibrio sp.]|jgi:ABC-type nitrate/sulfonate/bicarbonate transport system, permease component